MEMVSSNQTNTAVPSVSFTSCRVAALLVVGYALFQGWADVLYIGEVLALPNVSVDTHQVYILSRTVGFFTCFVVSRKVPSLVGKRVFFALTALSLEIGTLLAILSIATSSMTLALQCAGACLAGVGAGLFSVMWFEVLFLLKPVEALATFLLTALATSAIATPLHTVEFAVQVACAAAFPLLALLSVVVAGGLANEREVDLAAALGLPMFARTVALLTLFGFALAFREPSLGNGVFSSGSYTAIGSLAVAVVVLVGMAAFGSRFRISFVCRILLPVTAVVFLLMPTRFPLLDVASNNCGAACDELVKILAAYVLACQCWKYCASAVRVVGLAYGIHGIGVFFGRESYSSLVASGVPEVDIASWFGVIAAAIIAVTIFVLPSRQELLPLDIDRGLVARSEEAFDSLGRKHVVQVLSTRYGLTVRETEVLTLILDGKSVDEIAEELVIARETAKTHRRNVLVKCEVHSVGDLRELAQHSDCERDFES